MTPSYGAIEQREVERRPSSLFHKHRAVISVVGATLLIAAFVGTFHFAMEKPQSELMEEYDSSELASEDDLHDMRTELDNQDAEIQELESTTELASASVASAPAPAPAPATSTSTSATSASAAPASASATSASAAPTGTTSAHASHVAHAAATSP